MRTKPVTPQIRVTRSLIGGPHVIAGPDWISDGRWIAPLDRIDSAFRKQVSAEQLNASQFKGIVLRHQIQGVLPVDGYIHVFNQTQTEDASYTGVIVDLEGKRYALYTTCLIPLDLAELVLGFAPVRGIVNGFVQAENGVMVKVASPEAYASALEKIRGV